MSKIRLSLIQKISLAFVAVFLPFFFLLGYLTQSFLSRELIYSVDEAMKVVTANEAAEFDQHFASYEEIGKNSASFIKQVLEKPGTFVDEKEFNRKYKVIDGALRTNIDAYKNKDVSGVFLSNKSTLTPEIKHEILATEKGFDCYSKGVKGSVFNMYYIAVSQFIRIYKKDWALEIEPDHDFSKDLFYYIADPEHNPGKTLQWTPPYYDSIWKHWMTSVITPVYIDGKFYGIVGHDVILDELYKQILKKKYFKSGFGFIFDSDKNVIVHPKYLDKLVKNAKMGSVLKFSSLDEKGLESVISKAVKKIDKPGAVFMDSFTDKGKKYIFYGCKMEFTNWYFATIIPVAEAVGILPVFKEKFQLGSVVFALALLLCIIFFVWFYVIRPISKFTKAAKTIGKGDLDYRISFKSGDEMGAFAQAVNDMAANLKVMTASRDKLDYLVSEKTKELEQHKNHLEELVKERTKKLEEANEALKKENTYKILFESSSDAMLTICDGVVVDCNASAVKILKAKKKEDILNVNPGIFAPEFQPDGENSIEKAKRLLEATIAGSSSRFEWLFKDFSEKTSYVEVALTPIILEGKTMINISWRDISDRKLAEEKVKEYQEHLEELVKERTKKLEEANEQLKKENTYRVFFEGSPDAMISFCDGVFVDCTESAVKMLSGKSKEDILNLHPWDISPEFQPDGRKSFDKAQEMIANAVTKGSCRFEWLHKRLNGEVFPAEVSLTSINVEGKSMFNTSLRDISDRKLAEEKVKEYQEHLEELVKERTKELEEVNEALKKENTYRRFFESSPEAMFIMDKKGVFVDCNQSAVRMLRVKGKDDIINTTPVKWSPELQPDGTPISTEKCIGIINDTFISGANKFEWNHMRADGDVFSAEVLITAIIIDGKKLLHVVWRDISDRKQAELKVIEYQEHLEELVKDRTKELEEANETLKKENTFRVFFEGSPDAMQTLFDGVFIDCNQSSVKMLGAKSKEEILNTPPWVLSPEFQPDGKKSIDKAQEMIEKVLENGSHRFEWLHKRLNGEIFPVEVSLTAITIGGKIMFNSSWRDIAGKKEAERKVKEYQEHLEELVKDRTKELERVNEALKKENTYKLYFESTPDAMLIQDGNVYIDCNQGAVDMLKVKSKEDIINTTPTDWSPAVLPDGKILSDEKTKELIELTKKKGFQRIEWYHMRADGEVFPVEVSLLAITIEGRSLTHVSWRDISDRKKSEQKIKEYQERLEELVEERTNALEKSNENLQLEIKEHQRLESDIEQILDASGDAIRVLNDEYEIIYVNNQFAQFAKLDTYDIIGRKCFEVTPEKECRGEDCPLKRILRGEKKIEKDVKKHFYKGEVVPCSMTCAPYTDSDGKVVGMVENYRDISERVSAQELAEKNALQQGRIEMSNNILHDIGNAAVGTGTYIIRLLSDKNWAECKSLERLLDFIAKEKDGIAATLGKEKADSLLDFAKKLHESLKMRNKLVIDFGEKISKSVGHINSVLNLQRQYIKEGVTGGGYVNISHLLENAVLMQSANSEKRHIALTLHFEPGLPHSIPGDNTRLMQVILNVLKNSCEAFDEIKDDRSRYLKVNVTKFDSDDGENWVRIIFEDNAAGLSEETCEKVFDRGFTTKETGTGIGLDQCRSIINSHGGDIRIESQGSGKGASIIIELPY